LKKHTLTFLLTLLFLGCTQENSTADKKAQDKQPVAGKKIANQNENNKTNSIPIAKPVVSVVNQSLQTATMLETSIGNNSIVEEQNRDEEEIADDELAEEEENDGTPPPPKSQEEIEDEAKAEHTEVSIAEEDSDEIGMEKPDAELEDEAGDRVEEEMRDEEESEKSIKITEG